MVPKTAGAFDTRRHTCRGDVAFKQPGLVVTLCWTKTLQDGSALAKIPIAAIPGHAMDPVNYFHNMLALVPTKHTQDPLLTLPGGTVYVLFACHFISFNYNHLLYRDRDSGYDND